MGFRVYGDWGYSGLDSEFGAGQCIQNQQHHIIAIQKGNRDKIVLMGRSSHR